MPVLIQHGLFLFPSMVDARSHRVKQYRLTLSRSEFDSPERAMPRNLRVVSLCILMTALLSTGNASAQNSIPPENEAYTFESEIRLAPGEIYAVAYDQTRREFVETRPDRGYEALPPRAIQQVLRTPLWLREGFIDRMVDLHYDDIDVGENAVPTFRDIDGDGMDDLVVGNASGEPACFIAPYFKPYSETRPEISLEEQSTVAYGPDFEITGNEDGSITVTADAGADPQLIENLSRIEVSGNARPVFHDVTRDGLPDLLIGSSDGTISVYENYGLNDDWWFVSYTDETDRQFDEDVGYLSSPCIADIDGDGASDIICGAKDSGGLTIRYGPDFIESGSFAYDGDYPSDWTGSLIPAIGDFNNDGNPDHAIGFDDGSILIFISDGGGNTHLDPDLSEGLTVPGFASPCAADFDNDGIIDVVSGAGDGSLHFFRGTGDGFELVEEFFPDLQPGEYPSPAAYDFNSDGNPDLVVGNRAGEIKVYLAPDWTEAEGGLGLIGLDAFASPAFGDLTGDDVPEMLTGSVDGSLRYFEGHGDSWEERYSWEFHMSYGLDSISDYFDRTHPEASLLRGMTDTEAIDSFIEVFEESGDEYFDEVAFSFANTQTEILRAMSRLDNADLLLENARAIYDFASKVAYADISEKDDYTTIEYVSGDGTRQEMPRDIYYWWVVHPVVEYEIPARVDASYWRHDAEYYGITGEEWTRRELSAEEFEHTSDAYFWRTFLPHDTRYGKNLLEVVEPARNLKEAAYLVADWITFSGSRPGRWNEYGKASNDYQPLVIYEKNYGSCGEQAMLCVAFSRTALIPNAPVGCHGEDHAWNEWWMDDQWFKWDVGNAVSGLGHPWNEGVGHTRTPLLSITRHRGDGRDENTTTRPVNPPGSNFNPGNAPGYSETGHVTIRALDEIGDPVEGALVVIRSKWNNYFRTSIWDYTDPEGYCDFDLGYPITGSCVADIITPLGVTGTAYMVVRENEEFEYTYTLPGRFNPREPDSSPARNVEPGTETVTISAEPVMEEQRPRSFSTGRRAEIRRMGLYERTGYHGTRWFSEPNENMYGVHYTVLSGDEYENFLQSRTLPEAGWSRGGELCRPFDPDAGDVYVFYNPNRYTHSRIDVKITATMPYESPEIELSVAPVSGSTGEKIEFSGHVSDNLHVNALMVSFNGGVEFTDITDSCDREMSTFTYTWDTGAGGPCMPGNYSIVFRVEDSSGMYIETDPIDFILQAAREFTDQVIYQDNPETPLPVSSWILGPFTVNENERFLGIECSSDVSELDVDLFLFHDKNGNRVLDGMEEQCAKSTSPTAIETIIRNNPEPGAYWIFCQGWRVPVSEDVDLLDEHGDLSPARLLSIPPMDADKMLAHELVDILLSFHYNPAFILDVSPSDILLVTEPAVTGHFSDEVEVLAESFTVTLDGSDISSCATTNEERFAVSLDNLTLEVGKEYTMTIEADTVTGLHDSLTLNLTATEPETAHIAHEISDDGQGMLVTVEAIGENTLETARARIDDLAWFNLDLADDRLKGSVEIPLENLEAGEHILTVEHRVAGDDTESGEHTFQYSPGPQETLIGILPGDGSQVYDHKSVIIVYFDPEIRDEVESVTAVIDGTDITEDVLLYSDGLFYMPVEEYEKGEHVFGVEVTLSDGRVIEGRSCFTVMSMGEVEEE